MHATQFRTVSQQYPQKTAMYTIMMSAAVRMELKQIRNQTVIPSMRSRVALY
jgi:hypothetical protein